MLGILLTIYICGCIAILMMLIAEDWGFAHHWWNKPLCKSDWVTLGDVVLSVLLSWISIVLFWIRKIK